MKVIKVSIMVLLALVALLGAFNADKIKRLYYTVSLFNEDRIVSNFSDMRGLAPTAEIMPSSEPSIFVRSSQKLPESFEFNGTRQVSDFLEKTSTTALLVLEGNTITFEEYFQGTKDTDHRITWSVAKSFLSALFGIAVKEGAINSIEDPVTKYVHALIGTGYDGVRIKDVLQMSSGVGFNEDYYDFGSDINRFGRTFALGGSFDDFATTLKRERKPGSYLHYVSIDTHVLGMVIRAATGKEIVDYFEEKLWSRIQPESSVYYIVDSENQPMVLGGMNLRTRDFARFGQLYLNNGRLEDEQIVPSDWVKQSTTPDAPHLMPGKRETSERVFGYGYQWWIPEDADQEFLAMGIYGQFIYVNQKENVVIVKNSAHLQFAENNFEAASEAVAFFRAVAR